ncbi:MAG: hypothetical protein IJN56_04120 [Clostridia bacterium]|nr:hypothetical protein [Clostridia bacterium]
MKHRQIINLFCIALPVCVLLRAIQIHFTIDGTTGFIKQQYNDIATLITLVIFATVATMCVLAFFTENIALKNSESQPAVAITGILTSGMYLFEMFACFSEINGISGILLMFLGLLSALSYLAYGINKIYPYNFPAITLIIPTIYYVVKLIKLFISTSSLSLVTENIFLLFANSALLWFAFAFASFENEINNSSKRPKTIFACGITASLLCVVTALPKLLLVSDQNVQLSIADISSLLLMLSQAVFMLSHIICNFCPKEPVKKVTSKHS